MKTYLIAVLAFACIALAVVLTMTKQSDNAQIESDAGTLEDCSNRLDTAQSKIATRDGSLLTLSNSLAECAAASLVLSNQLTDAQSTNALQTEQITSLNQQVAAAAAENKTLGATILDLTNQMAALTQRIALTETSLAQTNQVLIQAHKDYSLLENRLRRDVAERVVVERKFYNLEELRNQIDNLKQSPFDEITAEKIYAGLDVEVNSNGTVHVLSPN